MRKWTIACLVLLGLCAPASAYTFYMANGTQLATVNPSTGAITNVGYFSSGGTLTMQGIAIDGSGNLYGVNVGNNQLYTISTTTGHATATANSLNLPSNEHVYSACLTWITNTTYNGLAIQTNYLDNTQSEVRHVATSGASGVEYASTIYDPRYPAGYPSSTASPQAYAFSSGGLNSIDFATGAYTVIAQTKDGFGNNVYVDVAAFSPAGTLYGFSIPPGNTQYYLCAVNLSTGVVSYLVNVGHSVGALAIH